MSEQEYEVEKLEGVRTRNGKKYFLVKWKGYTSADNTWEPVESLTGCKLMIKEFESRHTKGKSTMESEDVERVESSRDKENAKKGRGAHSAFEDISKFKVLKRIVSGVATTQQVSFKVLVKKTKKEVIMEHRELLEQDPLSLCLFYEQHIVPNY